MWWVSFCATVVGISVLLSESVLCQQTENIPFPSSPLPSDASTEAVNLKGIDWDTSHGLVVIELENRDNAESLADLLLRRHLTQTVNIGPASSNAENEKSDAYLLAGKFELEKIDDLKAFLEERGIEDVEFFDALVPSTATPEEGENGEEVKSHEGRRLDGEGGEDVNTSTAPVDDHTSSIESSDIPQTSAPAFSPVSEEGAASTVASTVDATKAAPRGRPMVFIAVPREQGKDLKLTLKRKDRPDVARVFAIHTTRGPPRHHHLTPVVRDLDPEDEDPTPQVVTMVAGQTLLINSKGGLEWDFDDDNTSPFDELFVKRVVRGHHHHDKIVENSSPEFYPPFAAGYRPHPPLYSYPPMPPMYPPPFHGGHGCCPCLPSYRGFPPPAAFHEPYHHHYPSFDGPRPPPRPYGYGAQPEPQPVSEVHHEHEEVPRGRRLHEEGPRGLRKKDPASIEASPLAFNNPPAGSTYRYRPSVTHDTIPRTGRLRNKEPLGARHQKDAMDASANRKRHYRMLQHYPVQFGPRPPMPRSPVYGYPPSRPPMYPPPHSHSHGPYPPVNRPPVSPYPGHPPVYSPHTNVHHTFPPYSSMQPNHHHHRRLGAVGGPSLHGIYEDPLLARAMGNGMGLDGTYSMMNAHGLYGYPEMYGHPEMHHHGGDYHTGVGVGGISAGYVSKHGRQVGLSAFGVHGHHHGDDDSSSSSSSDDHHHHMHNPFHGH